jgi:hypothetical protein
MRSGALSRLSTAERFRREIEAAEADGVARGDMRLRLTLGDMSKLRRDGSLAVSDISFTGGVMRFLGVHVEQGGFSESSLARSAEPDSDAKAEG